MKILVCGGRDYSNYSELSQELDRLDKAFSIKAVVQGAARGADTLAGQWAIERGKEHFPTPADWTTFGRSAGPIRNAKMLSDHPDISLVVAFPGGRGTENMITQARAKNIDVLKVGDFPKP